MSDQPFNPNAKGKKYWPSIKYDIDDNPRRFETEEEFKLEGEGFYDNRTAAQEAKADAEASKAKSGGSKSTSKAKSGGSKTKAKEPEKEEDTFDRDAAVAKLTDAGYEVTEDTSDDDIKAALDELEPKKA